MFSILSVHDGPEMRIYLCRHAEAASGTPDAERRLTERGRGQARHLGASLAAAEPRPTVVVSSPLARAVETAAAIAAAVGIEHRIDPLLAPGATVLALRGLVRLGEDVIVAVGHQPDCSTITRGLTGYDPGFAPAGMMALDVDAG